MSSHRTVEVPKAAWTVTRAVRTEAPGKALRDRRRVAVHRQVDVGDARLAAQEVAIAPPTRYSGSPADASSAASSVSPRGRESERRHGGEASRHA